MCLWLASILGMVITSVVVKSAIRSMFSLWMISDVALEVSAAHFVRKASDFAKRFRQEICVQYSSVCAPNYPEVAAQCWIILLNITCEVR